VDLAGNGVGNVSINTSAITAHIVLRGSSIVVIDFSQQLPDVARYAVRLDGVTDASGVTLGGVNQRQLTALKGDVDGDLKVTTADGVFLNQQFVSSINPFNSTQVRSDYNQDGLVNVADMSNMWANRYHDASGIFNPTITASPSPPANEILIDGTTVVLASTDTLGPAGIALTVRNGGNLDLGQTSQSVGTLTLTIGTISNGTLNATAYNLNQGTISANLVGQGAAMIKTGQGIVVLNGANSYSGGTTVVDGVLAIADPGSLPNGGDLSVGGNAQAAFAVLPLESQQRQNIASTVSAAALPVASPPAVWPAAEFSQSPTPRDSKSAVPTSRGIIGAIRVPPVKSNGTLTVTARRAELDNWRAAAIRVVFDAERAVNDMSATHKAIDLIMLSYGKHEVT
jgi:autotransporter-associated beta strand protein